MVYAPIRSSGAEIIAGVSEIKEDMGVTGAHDVLASLARGTTFLSLPAHKVVFHTVPEHRPWQHQSNGWLCRVGAYAAPTGSVRLRWGSASQGLCLS
jgi:hypothetical protein